MMNQLVIPRSLFHRLLVQLRQVPHDVAWCRVGHCCTSADTAWLARDFTLRAGSTEMPPSNDPALLIALTPQPPPEWNRPVDPLPPSVIGALLIGDGRQRGHLWGLVRTAHGLAPLHRLSLVGAGMHQIPVASDEWRVASGGWRVAEWERERWSRTMGALGGEEVWERLVRLRLAVIGCGRTGSLVATTLARLGVRDLTLIDPDVVEEHNLGEMDAVTLADIGKPKVEAVVATLHQLTTSPPHHLTTPPPHHLIALPIPVTADSALAACKRADVLFCCADNDAARLATAILATLYHKVLIDLGTGVHFPESNDEPQIANRKSQIANRLMGADVRLLLPADGCLLCRGNLAHYAQAVENLCNHRPPSDLQGNWSQQRAGSSRTLNQLAAHLGVQMWLDLVAGRIRESVWARLEFDDAGRLTVHYPPTHQLANSSCPLCAKAGLGDEGLGWT